jgi:hypothetical protein
MIKRMGMESSFGLTEGSTRGNGKMENSMESVSILPKMDKKEKVNGKTVSVSNGLIQNYEQLPNHQAE